MKPGCLVAFRLLLLSHNTDCGKSKILKKGRFPPIGRPMPEFAINPSNSLLRYDLLFAAAHHAKHGEADANAEKRESRGLRNRGGCGGSQKAVYIPRAVDKRTDDLPCVVDALGVRKVCARHIDLSEVAAGVEEAVAT